MVTKQECCLCADKTKIDRGDRLCISCLNKTAAFDDLQSEYDDLKAGVDDLRSRLTSVGQMLRHMLAHTQEGNPLVYAEIMEALGHVRPELAVMDAQDARIAAWRAAPYGTAPYWTEPYGTAVRDVV